MTLKAEYFKQITDPSPSSLFTEYFPEKDADTGRNLGWESRPNFCLMLALTKLGPIIGLEVSLSFFPAELCTYNRFEAHSTYWAEKALYMSPRARKFSQLEPLSPPKSVLNLLLDFEGGFEIPFTRYRFGIHYIVLIFCLTMLRLIHNACVLYGICATSLRFNFY